ncbi:MAG TPA: NAD-dependent epimerase/dehydratase family protein [Pyrinomonadaceae bacterium]|jgi:2'-hydroxyisoflavone reductase|nr:NAD-dependent epimerase/dehydratase family protein [Pyrinomonadaceae bacterium]
MATSRRKFLKLSAIAGGSAGLGLLPGASALSAKAFVGAISKAPKSLRLLILGGTGFTGPFQVRYALSRGHTVTVFNRGRTHPGELPKETEQLIGDRNGKLDALKGRSWDVVIDNPTSIPVWVRDAAQILQGNVERYVFISTISVYADTSKQGLDETAPLAKYKGDDAMKETQVTLRANINDLYGPLKALSEAEVEKWFPGKALLVRPGYIVGPGDESDRFTYWPLRVEHGGEVLAPGAPADPIQIIDARDLAEWTIRMVEQSTVGSFNAVGPKSKLGMGQMLEVMKKTTKSNASFTWVDDEFLKREKIIDDIPIWTSTQGSEIGYSTMNISKALHHGLTFRPLAETTKATLEWFRQQTPERQAKLRAGIKPERETEVLAHWHARK